MTELQIREAMLATDGIYGLVAERDGHSSAAPYRRARQDRRDRSRHR
jgi:hypothetical protein